MSKKILTRIRSNFSVKIFLFTPGISEDPAEGKWARGKRKNPFDLPRVVVWCPECGKEDSLAPRYAAGVEFLFACLGCDFTAAARLEGYFVAPGES